MFHDVPLFSSFALPLSIPFSPLCLQTPEELDDSDFETEDFDVRSRTSVQTEDDQLIAGQSARVKLSIISCGKSLQLLKTFTFNRSNPCPFIKTALLCVQALIWFDFGGFKRKTLFSSNGMSTL